MTNNSSSIFVSFSRKLTAVILIFLLISLSAIVIVWYSGTLCDLDNKFKNRQNLSDQILKQSSIWIDRGISLYELQYVPSLKEAIEMYQDAYQKTGENVTKLDLYALKKEVDAELNGDFDFYLVDKEGLVLKSTFKDDIGLDFKIWPKFYSIITKIRESGEFVPDRMVRGYSKTAPFRKFSYQGTSDGNYLLEISRNVERLLPLASNASYRELLNNLPAANKDIQTIELYNSQYEIVSRYPSKGTDERPSAETLSRVIRSFAEHANFEEKDLETGEIIRYTHLPISDDDSPSASEMSLVARTVFSTEERDREKLRATAIFCAYFIFMIIIAVGAALAGSRYLSRPIDQIVEDIQCIANGDLDYKIRPTGSSEFNDIELAINSLVANLKEMIVSLKNREEALLEELGRRWRAEENYKRLFESAHDAIFIIKDTSIESCNNAATRLIGRDLKDIIGKELYDFSPAMQPDGKDSAVAFRDNISRIVSGELSVIKWDFMKNDGKILNTEAQCSSVLSDDVILVMFIFRDVTELLEMKRRESAAISQIEENLVKLAAINDQIRNPLSSIAVLNELQGGEYEDKIFEQIGVIDNLINEVDKSFVKTDKVRLFLMKHYVIHHTGTEENEQNNQ
ncbi:MAG TPA: PAS domain-containing protein [Methanospirillum sp.]|jgi:PAS domain S-box-containing protein|uniref:PAS domain-containing protein n=1 Tax=Methanospirillum sp. TaxID=45200 RepID=UPI0009D2AC0E|nr:PAS domain-containing protein [Methanospirillum sp.]OQB38878.1 MAG: PAS fold protein [Euryarchaeota archaeon ADurb.Bin165]HPY59510.1 PAS domain-containing protein [Methanospirillum sp.]